MFRHHPDGYIYINDYNFTLEEFLVYEPEYALPEGYIAQTYVQGEYRTLYLPDGSAVAVDSEWEEGDAYLENLSVYLRKRDDKLRARPYPALITPLTYQQPRPFQFRGWK